MSRLLTLLTFVSVSLFVACGPFEFPDGGENMNGDTEQPLPTPDEGEEGDHYLCLICIFRLRD